MKLLVDGEAQPLLKALKPAIIDHDLLREFVSFRENRIDLLTLVGVEGSGDIPRLPRLAEETYQIFCDACVVSIQYHSA